MISPLRQKRRQETAREIQKTTLDLALRKNLEVITTEEIAAAAGVSKRTFFNYYPNKEAAVIGHPPNFSQEAKDALREGTGTLAVDIKVFLDKHMETLTADEAILKDLGNFLRSNEKVRGLLDRFLIGQRDELTEVLCNRIENRQTATAFAKNAVDTIGGAIALWEHSQDMSLADALDAVWEGLIEASRLLLSANTEREK